ncbi:MAG: NAD(P)/FAD-dependent oxidoreductase [Burkholderiales bacterium]|jgi:sulfide:quinone oxidoreductase|nr:NAD(P)/FAD-dependent oxidoreductase [Burkholderiales bacterium]
MTIHREVSDPQRRRLMQAALAAAMAAAAPRPAQARAVRTSARIVIVGGGAAGISMAARLRALLDGARITLLDGARQHIYQPGLTLVAAGTWAPAQVIEEQSRWMPRGIEWLQDHAAEIDPVAKAVITAGGKRLPYDFLVVAPGLELAFDQIAGFDPERIGSDGLGCVYAGPEAALGTYRMIMALAEKGGDALMTLPHTPLKCAGAPLKLTFITDDLLRRHGGRGRARVHFLSPLSSVFGVPSVNSRVLELWKQRDIGVSYGARLKAVDPGRRVATFATNDGDVEQGYDFLHVVPPMRAPAVVRQSALAVRSGPLADGGWLDVDKDSLRHRRYPDIFGCGDINGTPRGKTAATVKKGGLVAAANLAAVIAGREPALKFDGYTSCPMVTAIGRAMLIEFDYEGRLTPTLPGVEPLTESWFAWFLEERMLKPAYFAMLKGWT